MHQPADQLLPGFSQSTLKSLSWIPLVALNVFVIGVNIGLGQLNYSTYSIFTILTQTQTGPLCWTLNGEMFAEEAKSVSSSLATATNWTTTFLVIGT